MYLKYYLIVLGLLLLLFAQLPRYKGKYTVFYLFSYQQVNQLNIFSYFYQILDDSFLAALQQGLIVHEADNYLFREWMFFGVEAIILIFSVASLILLLRQSKGFKFQLVPIVCNIASMLVIITITIFSQDFQYYLAGYFIQLFTYFLFLFMFLSLVLKIRDNYNRGKLKILYGSMLGILILAVALIVLVFTKILSLNCLHQFKNVSFLVCLGVEFAIYITTLWLGIGILKSIAQINSEKIISGSGQDFMLLDKAEDQYIRIRKRQIITILATFTLTILMRMVWILLFIIFHEQYYCIEYQGLYFLESNNALGILIICLGQVVALVPNTLLPFALYVIPSNIFRKNSSLQIPTLKQADSVQTKTQY